MTIFALLLLTATVLFGAEEWVCPMPEHPKVYSEAGTCPLCPMQLVRKSDPVAGRTRGHDGGHEGETVTADGWVCPMPAHPKVLAAPGLCPLCGMDLVSKAQLDRKRSVDAVASAGRGPGANLKPPAQGKIRVAFPLSAAATMIDFAGPWEVFQDVELLGRGSTPADAFPFELYTVAKTRDPIRATGGMMITPDYTFENAPVPHVIIVAAQSGSPELQAWLKAMRSRVDVLASVCTGAFHLARAGLLEGKEATTHHGFYDMLAALSPKAKVVRGRRYVEADSVVATSGGLSSGIDLALHIVERYFGRDVAAQTAAYMEYSSDAWRTPARSGS